MSLSWFGRWSRVYTNDVSKFARLKAVLISQVLAGLDYARLMEGLWEPDREVVFFGGISGKVTFRITFIMAATICATTTHDASAAVSRKTKDGFCAEELERGAAKV